MSLLLVPPWMNRLFQVIEYGFIPAVLLALAWWLL
jgi:hypothetical protein